MSDEDFLDELLSEAVNELEKSTKKTLTETNIFDQESNTNIDHKNEIGGAKRKNLSVIHNGDTDSSDDEDNKYFEEKKYNQYGKEIKRLLPPAPSCSRDNIAKQSTWSKKIESGATKPPIKTDVYTDPVFGLRIVNPLISFTTLQDRMQGRESVSFANVKKFVAGNISEKNWVIAGVIVSKSSVKTSQKGNPFLIWSLSDLKNDIKIVSMFLFKSAYKQLWKTSPGTVVGILNPSVLDKKDGSKDEVCRKFNEVGSRMLSRGFIQLEKRHAAIHKRVKSLLPRRESERRVHPLSRHSDILQAVETRISMLSMTYMKYIENNLLCFIPGKVLDEMINVLSFVESDCTPPRTHQLLQELRDLSSMAMEHFDEHILPRVKEHKEQMDERRQAFMASFSGSPASMKQAKPFFVQHVNDLQKIKKQYKTYKHHIAYLNQNTQKLMQKMKRQNKRLKAQSIKIRDQERKIQEQSVKIQEQEAALADIKKHMDEWDQKYKDLTTELVRARDYILLKTSPKPAQSSESRAMSPPKLFKPTIKPRTAQLLLRNSNYGALHLDLERKRKSNLLPDIPVKMSRSRDEEEEGMKKMIPLKDPDKETESKSNLSFIIDNLIKTPLTGIKSRKRKIAEEIDLK